MFKAPWKEVFLPRRALTRLSFFSASLRLSMSTNTLSRIFFFAPGTLVAYLATPEILTVASSNGDS